MMLNLDPRKSLLAGKLLFSCEPSRILILATPRGRGVGLEMWSRTGGGGRVELAPLQDIYL